MSVSGAKGAAWELFLCASQCMRCVDVGGRWYSCRCQYVYVHIYECKPECMLCANLRVSQFRQTEPGRPKMYDCCPYGLLYHPDLSVTLQKHKNT